jgi:SAM-dependent methyltransferase
MSSRDPAAAFANVEQAEFWSQLAPTWLEFEDQLEQAGGPPGELAMARLELLPGQRVVDLGCGSGRTTLELAARVGPGGEVAGVDISAGMLARARERAARSGTGNVEFVYADVQVHELGEAHFDAAYSRFGVLFFADPVAAFANNRVAWRARRSSKAVGRRTPRCCRCPARYLPLRSRCLHPGQQQGRR